MKLSILALFVLVALCSAQQADPYKPDPEHLDKPANTWPTEWFNRPAATPGTVDYQYVLDRYGNTPTVTVKRTQLYAPTISEGVPCHRVFNVLLTADDWVLDQQVDIWVVSEKPPQRQYLGPLWIYNFRNLATGLTTCNIEPSHKASILALGRDSGQSYQTPTFDISDIEIGDCQPFPLEEGYTAEPMLFNNPIVPRGGMWGEFGVAPFSLYNSRGGRPLGN